jgi:hypothetical protein
MLKLLKAKPADQLETVAFSELLKPFDPLVTKFWDSFGPSNWGGVASETSGLIGCEAYKWAGGADDPRWTFPAEWLGRPSADGLAQSKLGIVSDGRRGVPHRREARGPGAAVHYMKDGALRGAGPGRHRVLLVLREPSSHPPDQLAAMRANRYAPHPVFSRPESPALNRTTTGSTRLHRPSRWRILHAGHGSGPQDRPQCSHR